MQREREGISDLFGGFGSGQSMFPSLFGGKNPFDDPFFCRPFGSRTLQESNCNYKEKGIVIEELDYDHEGEDSKSSKEPSIEHPDDDDGDGDGDDDDDDDGFEVVADGKSEGVIMKSEPYKVGATKPQNRSFSVHSCKVTYGGVNGAYYTSTRTTKSGSDGVVIEETKEADKTTGQAQHKISRGIHNKGHSVTRKLNTDGKVDTLQTLHNLKEDELAGFEEAWNSNNKCGVPDWNRGFEFDTPGHGGSEHRRDNISGDRFLPSMMEIMPRARWMGPENEAKPSGGKTKKVVRINID